MKRFKHLLSASALMILVNNQGMAVEVIDDRTVYTPKINICVSSFGNFIQSPEIIVSNNTHEEILRTKELLTRWIYEFNSAGFYLQQFEPSQFYWQFVETKKYIGAILIVTGDPINQKFYQVLGSGLNTCGKEFYGLNSPSSMNGDVFSFVVSKGDYILHHFEDWKFSEDESLVMSTALTHTLISKSERLKLARAPKKSKVEFSHRDRSTLASNQTFRHMQKRDTLPQISK